MIDARSLIQMDSDQAVKLAQASEGRAKELEAAVEVITSRFGTQKRISLDTVLKSLTDSVAEYRTAATPEFWLSKPTVDAPVQEEAPATPDAPVTDAVPDSATDETPKARGKR